MNSEEVTVYLKWTLIAWSLSFGRWTPIPHSLADGSFSTATTYVPELHRLYMFGGNVNGIVQQDAWYIDLGEGNELTTNPLPNTSTTTWEGEAPKQPHNLKLVMFCAGGSLFLLVAIVTAAKVLFSFRRRSNANLIKCANNPWSPWNDLFRAWRRRQARMDYRIYNENNRKHDIREKDLIVFQTILGVGYFGEVRKGEYFKPGSDSAVDVAVKQLKPGRGKERELMMEIETLQKVGVHPNVVEFYGSVTEGDSDAKILLEFCENGNMWSYLRKTTVPSSVSEGHKSCSSSNSFGCLLPEYIWVGPQNEQKHHVDQTSLLSWAYQISLGMEYLGSRNIVHRDLAARNVLLDGNLQAKVADFGLSRVVQPKSVGDSVYSYYRTRQNRAMPIGWMSLEALESHIYTAKSDVWAFGVTLWEIFGFCQSTPYDRKSTEALVDLLKRGERLCRPHFASEELYGVMSSCWNGEPKCRPSFTALANRLLKESSGSSLQG